MARLELCEASEPWIHDALGILPSKLPAVTALRLCSDVAVDTSESCRKPDVLPTLYAQLQQIHHLELAGSHFDDFSTFFACASAFPSLTRVQSRGITWSQPPSSAPVPGHNSPVVEVYAPKGTEVPWLWTLVNPLGGNDASAAPHPVLADADAAAFKYLFKAAMYGSSTCTYSLSHVDGSDGSRCKCIAHIREFHCRAHRSITGEAAVHCHKTGNSASVTIAPDTSDDAQRTGLSVIRTATLHLTPQGSTVSTDAWDFKNRLANIDHAFSKLPDTVLLNLYWDYWGTTEWYIKEDLKGPLFRNLTRAKRLVRHLAKGKGPVPVGYLPLPYRYRTS